MSDSFSGMKCLKGSRGRQGCGGERVHTCPPLYTFHLFIIVGILSIAIANLWREWRMWLIPEMRDSKLAETLTCLSRV